MPRPRSDRHAMRPFVIAGCVIGFILSQVGASLLFKVASQHEGRQAIWYFVLGNAAGIGMPFFLTFALRGSNPNVIYALCFGASFCVLQLASWYFFRQPLSTSQWAGVVLVSAGILLLQLR